MSSSALGSNRLQNLKSAFKVWNVLLMLLCLPFSCLQQLILRKIPFTSKVTRFVLPSVKLLLNFKPMPNKRSGVSVFFFSKSSCLNKSPFPKTKGCAKLNTVIRWAKITTYFIVNTFQYTLKNDTLPENYSFTTIPAK